jgi:hypothetical protein
MPEKLKFHEAELKPNSTGLHPEPKKLMILLVMHFLSEK